MELNIIKKKQKVKINYLELTPTRKLEQTIREDGLVDVLVPKFRNKFFIQLIPPSRSKFIKANLDEIGSATWLLIDGKNKVETISQRLLEQFGERIEPINERLTSFLTQLYHNGFISFNELQKGKENG